MRFFMLKYSVERKILRIASVVICVFWLVFILFIVNKGLIKRYEYPLKYKEEIISVSNAFGFESALIFSMVKTESSFNEKAQSKKGAKGLMQLLDSTAKFVAEMQGVEKYDIFNVQTNLSFGCCYLKYLSKKFTNLKTAIVAYNAGEGNVNEWLKNKEYSKDGRNLIKIPFRESEEYLEKIEKSLSNYKKLYKNILDKGKTF